jgi:hypothetical protein
MSTLGNDSWLKKMNGLLTAGAPAMSELVFDSITGVPKLSERMELRRDRDYFGLTVNQIWLRNGREMFSTYDPLVYVEMDFLYGGDRVTVPKVIGPSMLKSGVGSSGGTMPHGFILRDARAGGPYPYRGDQVGITIVLYKVRHTDYAKRVLGFVEKLSGTFGLAGEVLPVSKIGGSVKDAIETLFDMGDSVPVLGHRFEINASPVYGFQPRSVALIGADIGKGADMRVEEGRLLDSLGGDYRENDYVLYTIWGTPSCENESRLPFHGLVHKMKECARIGDEPSWQRGKSLLLTLYQQMLESPDVTQYEASMLFEKYKKEMLEQRELSARLKEMSAEKSHGRNADVHASDVLKERLDSQTCEIFSASFGT